MISMCTKFGVCQKGIKEVMSKIVKAWYEYVVTIPCKKYVMFLLSEMRINYIKLCVKFEANWFSSFWCSVSQPKTTCLWPKNHKEELELRTVLDLEGSMTKIHHLILIS